MTATKTLAMVQTAPRVLEPRELPLPEIGDDDGLLRIEACGICGSDYEQFEGELRTPMPAIPGHDPLRVIERIGEAAARRGPSAHALCGSSAPAGIHARPGKTCPPLRRSVALSLRRRRT